MINNLDLDSKKQTIHESAVKTWWNLGHNAKKWNGETYDPNFETHLHYWIRQKKTLDHVESLKLDKNSRILELGFGGGETAVKLLQYGYFYYGIDISKALCHQANKKYYQYVKSGRAHFLEGSLEKDLPFNDNFFDLVIICGAIHYAGNLTKNFSEVRRVLKKDGYYIIGQGNMYTLNDLIVFKKFFKSFIWFMSKENFQYSYSLSFKDIIFESKFGKFFTKFKNNTFFNSKFMTSNSNKWEYKIYKRLFSVSRLKKLVKSYNFEIIEISGGPFLYNSKDKVSFLKKIFNLFFQKMLDLKILPFLIYVADNIVLLCKVKK